MNNMPPVSNFLNTCPYYIIGSSTENNPRYFQSLRAIVRKCLDNEKIPFTIEHSASEWKYEVSDLSSAMHIAGLLMQKHTYLEARKSGVELFIAPKTDPLTFQHYAIQIGARPPTRNDLKTCEEVYFKQYLPDHSLPETRLIHTVATVFGVCLSAYGIFNQNWLYAVGGIGAIYEAGFHSHLFVERNIPSSTKYPLESIYSDVRVAIQTLLEPFTGGMTEDLKKAGMEPY